MCHACICLHDAYNLTMSMTGRRPDVNDVGRESPAGPTVDGDDV